MTHDGPWLAYRVPAPSARVRLFCLPYAGGGASLFRGWAAALAPAVEVCPVQLPGRETRAGEQPVTHLEALVAALADGLEPHLGPRYALFGHSMGALLSFELARELRRRGVPPPEHLAVASYCAPPLFHPDLARPASPDGATAARLAAAAHDATTAELWRALGPTIEADVRLCEGYRYADAPPLACPLSVYRGHDDYVSAADLDGWRHVTTGRFRTQTFLGDHFFVRGAPRGLLQAVGRVLQG